jgi:hypothetical protein
MVEMTTHFGWQYLLKPKFCSMTRGRTDIKERYPQKLVKSKLTVISCGPAEMDDDVWKIVAACVRKGYSPQEVDQETLSSTANKQDSFSAE